ncbi:MAG: PEP-CTERM sorting domain-containing protein [Verrucomicrobiota bacterium]
MNSPTVSHRPLALLGLSLLTALSAQATLLVYEGFHGYDLGAMEGQTPNGNTTGLDQSVGYYDGATTSRADKFSVQSAGLSLGSLQTSGGSLQFITGTGVIGADIDIGPTAHTGTLWGSYLVNLTSKGSGGSDGAVLRIGSKPSESTAAHFNSWADSRSNSANIAVGYASGTANGNGSLTNGTTYIIISKFTRVGQTVDTTNTGVATQWALDAGQFADFLDAGGDEAALNSVSITGVSTSTVSSITSNAFSSSMAFGLVTVNDTGTFDEIRFGTDLADVTPIPEPGSLAALAGLCSIFAFATRRRRA